MSTALLTYLAVFTGVALEGEAALVAASVAAHERELNLALVLVVAFVAAYGYDATCFYLGRVGGRGYLNRRPRLRARADRLLALAERHPVAMLIGYRFILGTRTAVPLAYGAAGGSATRFLGWGLARCGLWVGAYAGLGWAFGERLMALFEWAAAHKGYVLAAAAVVGAGFLWRYATVSDEPDDESYPLAADAAAHAPG